jgi:hypothetical protein
MEFGFFYDSPIWLVAMIIFAVNLAAVEIGYRVALRHQDESKDGDSGGGNLVVTSLFALLGLILAFTFAAGVSRHELRKQSAVTEANALGTAFLSARLVAEPGRTELMKALLDYAHTRSIKQGVRLTPAQRAEVLARMLRAQRTLWPITEKIVGQGKPGHFEASLVRSIHDLLDQHTVRVAAAFDKLPAAVVWMLVLIAAASLSVTGFNAGLSGRMSRWRVTAFAAVLAGVMYMIVDFDRPLDGLIQVSQASIETTISDMEASSGR